MAGRLASNTFSMFFPSPLKWSSNASRLIAHLTRLSPSFPQKTIVPFVQSSCAFGSGNTRTRLSTMPSTPNIFSAVPSSIVSAPLSKFETVGVLTSASVASRACVSFCALRLCFASSTIAGQLMRSCRSIAYLSTWLMSLVKSSCLPLIH